MLRQISGQNGSLARGGSRKSWAEGSVWATVCAQELGLIEEPTVRVATIRIHSEDSPAAGRNSGRTTRSVPANVASFDGTSAARPDGVKSANTFESFQPSRDSSRAPRASNEITGKSATKKANRGHRSARSTAEKSRPDVGEATKSATNTSHGFQRKEGKRVSGATDHANRRERSVNKPESLTAQDRRGVIKNGKDAATASPRDVALRRSQRKRRRSYVNFVDEINKNPLYSTVKRCAKSATNNANHANRYYDGKYSNSASIEDTGRNVARSTDCREELLNEGNLKEHRKYDRGREAKHFPREHREKVERFVHRCPSKFNETSAESRSVSTSSERDIGAKRCEKIGRVRQRNSVMAVKCNSARVNVPTDQPLSKGMLERLISKNIPARKQNKSPSSLQRRPVSFAENGLANKTRSHGTHSGKETPISRCEVISGQRNECRKGKGFFVSSVSIFEDPETDLDELDEQDSALGGENEDVLVVSEARKYVQTNAVRDEIDISPDFPKAAEEMSVTRVSRTYEHSTKTNSKDTLVPETEDSCKWDESVIEQFDDLLVSRDSDLFDTTSFKVDHSVLVKREPITNYSCISKKEDGISGVVEGAKKESKSVSNVRDEKRLAKYESTNDRGTLDKEQSIFYYSFDPVTRDEPQDLSDRVSQTDLNIEKSRNGEIVETIVYKIDPFVSSEDEEREDEAVTNTERGTIVGSRRSDVSVNESLSTPVSERSSIDCDTVHNFEISCTGVFEFAESFSDESSLQSESDCNEFQNAGITNAVTSTPKGGQSNRQWDRNFNDLHDAPLSVRMLYAEGKSGEDTIPSEQPFTYKDCTTFGMNYSSTKITDSATPESDPYLEETFRGAGANKFLRTNGKSKSVSLLQHGGTGESNADVVTGTSCSIKMLNNFNVLSIDDQDAPVLESSIKERKDYVKERKEDLKIVLGTVKDAKAGVNVSVRRIADDRENDKLNSERRITRGLTKINKENFVGKLVWGFCSGWWPGLIIDAEHAGMISEPGKLWVYWLGESRISLLNEKTQIEPFSNNLEFRLGQKFILESRTRAIDATIQMLRDRFDCVLTKPYHAWIKKAVTRLTILDKMKFYPYPSKIQRRLDHLKEKNARINERYLSRQKRSPEQTKRQSNEKHKESPPSIIDLERLPLMVQKPGVIAWAKITGHNWWPAMIIDYRDCCMREPSFGCQWIMWYGDYKLSEIHHLAFLKFDKGLERMRDYTLNTKKHLYLVGVLHAAKDYYSRLGFNTDDWTLSDVLKYSSQPAEVHVPVSTVEVVKSDKKYGRYSAQIIEKLNDLKKNSNVDEERKNCIKDSEGWYSVINGKTDLESLCLRCLSVAKSELEEHPFFNGSLCKECSNLYKPCIFVFGDDGKCFYCTLCAGSGTVVMCDREECPRVYCTACLKYLICPATFDNILLEDPWECFLCKNDRSHFTGLIAPRADWKDRIVRMFHTSSHTDIKITMTADYKKRKIRVLSLFDGLSTGLLVLHKLGIIVDVYYASEIDNDALLVSSAHFGNQVIQLGDVRNITKQTLKEIVPIDLLIGGSPCNDLSLANPARLGLYDPRGTGVLFFEYCRIMDLLKKANKDHPLFWLYENVASMPTEYRVEINKYLGQEPDVIDSADFSPQHRLRLYWHNLPLDPATLSFRDQQDVQDILTPHCNRYALVKKIRTVTTKVNSLKQGKAALKPILMKDESDSLWITELEEIFGFPRHYTDVKNLCATKRQKLIGRSWSVQTLTAILQPLRSFFDCN